jgi:hypothetical protein
VSEKARPNIQARKFVRTAFHIQAIPDQLVDHDRRGGRIVSHVSVNQNIQIGLDIGEHATDDIAFALTGLGTNHGAGSLGASDCVVCRVVVEHVNDGLGQRPTKAVHRLFNRRPFVIAWDNNCD